MLVEDLQNYHRQFESIKTDAQTLLGDLNELQFNWQPGSDRSRTKVSNAVSRWFRLSLGQELAFDAAHERRHLWQAKRVKDELGFLACQQPPGKSLDQSAAHMFRNLID